MPRKRYFSFAANAGAIYTEQVFYITAKFTHFSTVYLSTIPLFEPGSRRHVYTLLIRSVPPATYKEITVGAAFTQSNSNSRLCLPTAFMRALVRGVGTYTRAPRSGALQARTGGCCRACSPIVSLAPSFNTVKCWVPYICSRRL